MSFDKSIFLAKYGTQDHITKAQRHPNPDVRIAAMDNPMATKEHIDTALDDTDYSHVRALAIEHKNVNKSHIDKALTDSDPIVRRLAILNPKSTVEHANKAMNDTDGFVRKYAKEKLNV